MLNYDIQLSELTKSHRQNTPKKVPQLFGRRFYELTGNQRWLTEA